MKGSNPLLFWCSRFLLRLRVERVAAQDFHLVDDLIGDQTVDGACHGINFACHHNGCGFTVSNGVSEVVGKRNAMDPDDQISQISPAVISRSQALNSARPSQPTVFPALLGLAALAITYRTFQFITLVYFLIMVHAWVLFVGGITLTPKFPCSTGFATTFIWHAMTMTVWGILPRDLCLH
jgi:hypothetical protein